MTEIGCALNARAPPVPPERDEDESREFAGAPLGEQPVVETVSAEPIVADTFAGRAHVEWVSEDAVRRAFDKIDARAGVEWLQEHLDYCTRPLLDEPWILDVDTTVKPLYGHQEGAVVSYNPHKLGRPPHSYHSYMLANPRLVLAVEVAPGNQHTSKHSEPGAPSAAIALSPPQCLASSSSSSP